MSNSIKRKTADERMKAIAKGLSTSMVANTSPNYQSQLMAQQTYATEEKYITVTLDKLRPYEHNPRRTPNPNFEMIKESIRRRGLDHAPNITQRPGEDFYIIADGGKAPYKFRYIKGRDYHLHPVLGSYFLGELIPKEALAWLAEFPEAFTGLMYAAAGHWDINIVGSDVSGKQGTRLQADDEINLLAAKQTHQERSKNNSQGFNAGVAVSYGSDGFALGVTAGGNYGKGYGNGDETTWRHSHIGDKASQTEIQSGGDTTVRGAQVRGKGITVDAENLNVESLQDTMRYTGKQINASGQATVGYGFSGSASYNQSKINADYASVQEQSGLFAGDEGYQVNVRKHTDLKGGLITSTSQAEADGKNSFSTGTLTHSDIQNYSNYSAKGFGLSGGVTVSGGDAPKEMDGMSLQHIGQNAQDGSSKVEYSGVAGVGSQGNWGITKGITTALLGQVKDKGSESGITTSLINTANLTIRNRDAQQKLIGKTAEESLKNLPKINLHQRVEKVDVETIRSGLERDLNTATEFVNNTNEVGDEIYYRIEKNEQNIYLKHKKDENCQSIECIKISELNVDQLTVPTNKEEAELLSRSYVHGIMNTSDQDRTTGAIQYGGKEFLNNDVLIVRKPYSSLPAELVYTIFERLRGGLDMPSVFGASNASRDQSKIWGLLDEYNRQNPTDQINLSLANHSLGASSTKNAMNWANYEGMTFKNTTLNAYVVGTS
ncbi:hypothetical protein A1D23_00510 [Chelonobacter oris]|uniref:hemagglutinin repeat-containing protein n=1 Tax=Chelonobacter oris TaxID=505317 RepID=UPI002A3052D4|nr:hypothetical protein [Chelonobacter oris]